MGLSARRETGSRIRSHYEWLAKPKCHPAPSPGSLLLRPHQHFAESRATLLPAGLGGAASGAGNQCHLTAAADVHWCGGVRTTVVDGITRMSTGVLRVSTEIPRLRIAVVIRGRKSDGLHGTADSQMRHMRLRKTRAGVVLHEVMQGFRHIAAVVRDHCMD